MQIGYFYQSDFTCSVGFSIDACMGHPYFREHLGDGEGGGAGKVDVFFRKQNVPNYFFRPFPTSIFHKTP